MKILTLLRHGKSDWSADYLADYDRPLKARGRRDALAMGEYVASLDLVPELIVSSPAERAQQTAELFAEAAGYDEEIAWADAIYGATPDELLAVLCRLPDDAEHILLVGHNPGFEELASHLIGTAPHGPTWDVRLPTAAIAHMHLDVPSWRDVQYGCGQLQWWMTPKLLRESSD
jgi:phosphohistidine phosphatase